MKAIAPERSDWSNTEELLATLIEVVDRGQLWFWDVHTKKGAQRPKSIEITRPGEQPAKKVRRPATSAELKAFFGNAARFTGGGGNDGGNAGPRR